MLVIPDQIAVGLQPRQLARPRAGGQDDRFGRFPFRNAALGRASTPEEEAFLTEGGYASMVNQLRAQAMQ